MTCYIIIQQIEYQMPTVKNVAFLTLQAAQDALTSMGEEATQLSERVYQGRRCQYMIKEITLIER